MIQTSFYLCVISRYIYIFFLLDVLSIFCVQSRGPIRNCNNNITDNSLTQCWPRALWVTQVVCVNGNNAGRSICERYLFISKRKLWRALNPTKNEKLIPKIANLREWTDKIGRASCRERV